MTNPLSGKLLYAFGSSIVNGHLANVSFVEDVAHDNDMQYRKFAINGATTRTSDPNNILKQIKAAPSITPDFIIFDSWANDAYPEIADDPAQFGEITTGFDAELNDQTYCGGLETICKTLTAKYEGAQFILLATHKTPARELRIQEKMYAAAMEIAHKWSIDVIDLFNAGSFNAFIKSYQYDYSYDQVDAQGGNHAYGGSGTHPNADGYRRFYDPIITNKLLSFV
ncbi:SGNH/GDSL hydrolase family protein [Lactiplantibacillus modestisalitolerans]|uniref:SGNH/GDSL hydrolase family protein n=1 Tax=Lactiplantibacillus modestisalitolerans TaxID=1457219 RepID=A0ABV5WV68_9LACO|nr:SGNH/GDSL hydrolase family protein [Lactiplantibacillus modestisalitolerans]